MEYTRLYSDSKGDTHFETVSVPLHKEGMIGYLSEKYPVSDIQFRKNDAGYDWDYHTAPARQFIVLLDGGVEITTSLGEKRQFNSGEVILVEDVTGKGHKTKNLEKRERKSLFIRI
ncbi:hypothetical protein QLX67_02310 [Balneolaceae bacterium ANBcel3]|nr:hypothetical protein [Balneolaceae bacterium ANBcel3]